MRSFLIGLSALALVASQSAQSQPGHSQPGERHDGERHDAGQQDRGQHGYDQDRWQPAPRRHNNWGRDRGENYRWRRGQQMGYNDWQRAERIDYRQAHLRKPPRGYEWRRYNDQYVLAAVATGLIASILIDRAR
jgi:Ni/Co efflux regulator RcnB